MKEREEGQQKTQVQNQKSGLSVVKVFADSALEWPKVTVASGEISAHLRPLTEPVVNGLAN